MQDFRSGVCSSMLDWFGQVGSLLCLEIENVHVLTYVLLLSPEPGEFQFEEPHYYAIATNGTVTLNVVRQKGCDGVVTIEYSTM